MTEKHLTFRFTQPEDGPYLAKWLEEPAILRWFPMCDLREIDDAVRVWMSYAKIQAGLTALWDGQVCGLANLYIQPFKKLAHTCLFAILVQKEYRSKGVGKWLMEELIQLARSKFHIEVLHLEVYESNPAKRLYERLGFQEYGRQERFIKEDKGYLAKIFMQKELG